MLLDLVHKTNDLLEVNRQPDQKAGDRISLLSSCTLPGTILVHCSAGVGRTGTFLAVYKLWLDYINPNVKELSVFSTVLALRRQRCLMVQKKQQYAYIAKCLRFGRKVKDMANNALSSVLSSAQRKETTMKAEGFLNKHDN